MSRRGLRRGRPNFIRDVVVSTKPPRPAHRGCCRVRHGGAPAGSVAPAPSVPTGCSLSLLSGSGSLTPLRTVLSRTSVCSRGRNEARSARRRSGALLAAAFTMFAFAGDARAAAGPAPRSALQDSQVRSIRTRLHVLLRQLVLPAPAADAVWQCRARLAYRPLADDPAPGGRFLLDQHQ